ncbi:MAG: flagellar hook assembly protein FlgD [Silicimonas sp.]|nr:flagellar hook assembly protein FlgD [Silicimonas sp.]
MEIQSQSQSQFTPQTQSRSAQGASDALSSDFETFLLMLTTQMENQDPLNPIESQDFAVQLATFSGVEQQVRTNDLLESLAGGLGASGIAQLASWVGMEARSTAPAQFDGVPLTLAPEPAPGADSAVLVARNAFGMEVSRQEIPLGQTTIEWAGTAQNATPLASGQYRFTLESFSQGELIAASSVSSYARVTEARQGMNGVEIVLEGGVVVPSEQITALRESGSGP